MNNMKDKPSDQLFKYLLKVEGFCPMNNAKSHRWNDNTWIDGYRVWLRRCLLCGAIEVWRGNDTIYMGPTPEMPNVKTLVIFHHKHDFTAALEAAKKLLTKVLQEAT